jgi:5-methylcytosine-specific restriction endonuclease McrA
MQSLDRHNASKMHEIRSSLVKKYTCECGKYYIHQQSLRNHKMKCEFEGPKITPTFSTPLPEQTALEEMQQELEKTKEKMQQEINETKEKMQQELDKTKDEIKKMKEEIKKIKTEPKSRDIRKQINKETRTEVVIEQENKCGECKEELSLYFQIDHVVGIQFGGTNDKSNLMALCCECHTKKSIAENKCRRQIKEAIQTILRENS